MQNKGQKSHTSSLHGAGLQPHKFNIVLEKTIFSQLFEKDIRRAFIYNKSERLAKVIHVISPAFKDTPALRECMERIAVELVEAAVLPLKEGRGPLEALLLKLASMISIAKSSSLLSIMNAEIILKEVHTLIGEVGAYEEPHLLLEEELSLSKIAHTVSRAPESPRAVRETKASPLKKTEEQPQKGHVKDIQVGSRRSSIVEIIRNKGVVSIKDISVTMRNVSEKTVQRELQSLVEEGIVKRTGERRWSSYSLVS